MSWELVVKDLVDQIERGYKYHYKQSQRLINNHEKWLSHDNAAAQCENLLETISNLCERHGVKFK